jgi:hypothetical protein
VGELAAGAEGLRS